jgi:hypothetical protein
MTGNLTTLLIAHDSSPELPSLRETILSLVVPPSAGSSTSKERLHTAPSLDEAITEIQAGWFPDLVVVYQGVPDEFPQSQIDELIGLLPLARFIVAFGPWCESVGRTEQRWPIAWCIPIRHLATRVQRELLGLNTDKPITPPTASRDEAFSESAARVNSTTAGSGLSAAVFGDDRHFVETVRDQLIASSVDLVSPSATPDFVFVPATRMSDHTDSELRRLRNEYPNSEMFLLSDLLTPGQIDQLLAEDVVPISQLRFGEELAGLIASQKARPVTR